MEHSKGISEMIYPLCVKGISEFAENYCNFGQLMIYYIEGKRKSRKQMKEVNEMKKNMMKLLKAYIRKYNGINSDLILDGKLGCDIKYDKGKTYILSAVIYDMAELLDVSVSMDIKGFITIAE